MAKVTEKDWKTDRRCAAVRQGNVYDYKSPKCRLVEKEREQRQRPAQSV